MVRIISGPQAVPHQQPRIMRCQDLSKVRRRVVFQGFPNTQSQCELSRNELPMPFRFGVNRALGVCYLPTTSKPLTYSWSDSIEILLSLTISMNDSSTAIRP